MTACWNIRPEMRPTFKRLEELFAQLIPRQDLLSTQQAIREEKKIYAGVNSRGYIDMGSLLFGPQSGSGDAQLHTNGRRDLRINRESTMYNSIDHEGTRALNHARIGRLKRYEEEAECPTISV